PGRVRDRAPDGPERLDQAEIPAQFRRARAGGCGPLPTLARRAHRAGDSYSLAEADVAALAETAPESAVAAGLRSRDGRRSNLRPDARKRPTRTRSGVAPHRARASASRRSAWRTLDCRSRASRIHARLTTRARPSPSRARPAHRLRDRGAPRTRRAADRLRRRPRPVTAGSSRAVRCETSA